MKKDELEYVARRIFSANESGELEQASQTLRKLVREMLELATIEGYKRALSDFAWYKDGTQYVGCGFYTFDDILKELGEK